MSTKIISVNGVPVAPVPAMSGSFAGPLDSDLRLPGNQLPLVIDSRVEVLSGPESAILSTVLGLGELASPNDRSYIRKGDGVTAGGTIVGMLKGNPSGTSSNIYSNVAVLGSPSGSARGVGAVDLQQIRNSNAQVAGGGYSVICGGQQNVASGVGSMVGGGSSNTSSGYRTAVGGGVTNTASGYYSAISGGASNIASGDSAFIGGGSSNDATGGYSTVGGGIENTASGYGSVAAGGAGNTASGQYSVVIGGTNSLADRYGMEAYSCGIFTTTGDSQRVSFVARATTTNDSFANLWSNGGTQMITVPVNKIMAFIINIAGVRVGGADVAMYVRQGVVRNLGGTVAILGTVNTVGVDIETNSLTDATVTANDFLDTLQINVKGIAGQTWRWTAHVQAVEIGF